MKNIIAFFIVNLFAFHASCQYRGSSNLDSLQALITNAKEDTTKVNLLLEISINTACVDTSLSLLAIKSAWQLAEKLKWQKGKIVALNRMGYVFEYYIKDHQKSLYYYYQSEALAEATGYNIKQALACNAIGQIYENITKYDSALEYYKKSLELNDDPIFQIGILGNSGQVYSNLGDYPRALECYEQAIKLTEGLLSSVRKNKLDSLTMSGLLLTIGDIYVSMSQYDNALDNYKSGLKIAQTLNNDFLEMLALNDIGKVYKLQNDFVSAIQYYEKSLNVSNSLNEYQNKAGILNELGNVYLETGDLTKALNYAGQSLTIVEWNKDMQQMPKTYTTLGQIYTQTKNYKDAVTYLTKAINICKTTGALADEKDAWEVLSNTYGQMNETAKSFDAYRHFISLRDSVYNVDKAKELVRIDLQSGFGRKQLTDSLKQDEARKVFRLRLQKQRAYTYGGFAGLLLVLLLLFFIYRNYNQQKKANKIISNTKERIQKEKQVSEALLLNILPEEVAQELKTAGKVHAKLYDEVTVLFTDFVNFTKAGERLSPQLLVAELDTCFQAFDEIISKYNIEKIKTVGDAYLAVSGLPHANPAHASDIVKAAIEIRDYMLARHQQIGDLTFEIRIGINSGSVVAGIVGLKKFAYDIWGDTVNTAARMEQYGAPGKINISETTYLLLKGAFTCQYRGKIEAKNKGTIDMYFVG